MRLFNYLKFSKVVLSVAVTAAAVAPLISCSSAGKKGWGIGGSSDSGYELPNYQEKTLGNGLKVLYVHDDSLPYISYSVLIKAGSARDPEANHGLAAMVAELLDKGTAKRTAPQIAKDLGLMGANFDASASVDYSLVSLSGLSTHAEPLLNNISDLVINPAFYDQEVERVRKQTLAQINRRVDNPGALSDLAWLDFMYGSHPYGKSTVGNAKSIKAIRKKNLIQYYLRYYRPNNAILAVTGKFTPELAAKIEAKFGAWDQRPVEPQTFAAAPKIEGVQIRLVDKPGLVQSQIRVGHAGIKRTNEDFLALRVANTALGGAFASRLVDRVRKQLGLTYSINSYFDARQDIGPFQISTFTKNESTGQTINEILNVVRDFREKGISKEELDRVKGYLKGIFPSTIETPEKLAFNLMILRHYGIPDSYLEDYLENIDDISVGDVNGAIKKYIDERNVKVVVYSSAPSVLPQLKALGNVEVKKASEFQ